MASEIAGLGRLSAGAFVLSLVKLQESGQGEMRAARFPVLLPLQGTFSPSPVSGFDVCVQLLPLYSLCPPQQFPKALHEGDELQDSSFS